MSEEVQAYVEVIDGQMVLHDPVAEGVISAIEHHNRKQAKIACREVFKAQMDRVEHFKSRVTALGRSPDDVVITLINADDVNGSALADILMPGANWQEIRDRGEVPYARGLATRGGITDFLLSVVDKEAGDKLNDCKGLAVVVVAFGTAEIFEV